MSEKNIKLRWILIVVFLAIGATAITFGIWSALETPPGWAQVSPITQNTSWAADFVLNYDFPGSGALEPVGPKQLGKCYGQAMEEAYRCFSPDLREAGLRNLAYLNDHPNEAVIVEEPLWQALELVAESGDRTLFLAPAEAEYSGIFLCENDLEAETFDPERNAEMAQWLGELAGFVRDPEHIRLELGEGNSVTLRVSEEYLAFAQDSGVEQFLDFGWMRNAFVADFVAEKLREAGYTRGTLSSYDGFTRNLDVREGEYSLNIFHRQGTDVYLPARLRYSGPASLVYLRDHPMNKADRWHYYTFASGKSVSVFLDPEDCRSKGALPDLVSYSGEKGCAQILMEVAGAFVADEFRPEILAQGKNQGVYSVWTQGKTLRYNDPGAVLEAVPEKGGEQYTIAYTE